MVLATRCPHCKTTFRVVQDQLKLRGGLVRCGACKEIFNGVDNLLRPVDRSAPPGQAPAGGTPGLVTTEPVTTGLAAPPAADAAASIAPVPPAPAGADDAPKPDPLLRMTLMDFSAFHGEDEDAAPEPAAAPATASSPAPAPPPYTPLPGVPARQPDFALPRMPAQPPAPTPDGDELSRAIDDLKRSPWRGTQKKPARADEDAIDALDSGVPEFIAHASRRQRLEAASNTALIAGSALLALALLLQGIYAFRVQLAASLPYLAPALERTCAVFGCKVGLPAQIDLVTIESSELQALPANPDTLALVALLRNRSSTRQEWPHIELTLNDADEKPLARRVFAPGDYLPAGQDPAKGFAPNSEQALKLVLSLAQLKAAGYRVYLFYP